MAFYIWNNAREQLHAPFQIVLTQQEWDTAELDGIIQVSTTGTVDSPAKPVGGMKAFYQHLKTELQYPTKAYEQNITGQVFVQFDIDTDGTIKRVKTIKGIGYGCNKEAERVISNSPKWTPASHEGEILAQTLVVPIWFGKQ